MKQTERFEVKGQGLQVRGGLVWSLNKAWEGIIGDYLHNLGFVKSQSEDGEC